MKSMMQADSGQTASEVVIEAVAEAKGVDPVDLEAPLHTVIDVGALDTLFASHTEAAGRIVFEYDGYEVTVESDHTVEVRGRASNKRSTLSRPSP